MKWTYYKVGILITIITTCMTYVIYNEVINMIFGAFMYMLFLLPLHAFGIVIGLSSVFGKEKPLFLGWTVVGIHLISLIVHIALKQ